MVTPRAKASFNAGWYGTALSLVLAHQFSKGFWIVSRTNRSGHSQPVQHAGDVIL